MVYTDSLATNVFLFVFLMSVTQSTDTDIKIVVKGWCDAINQLIIFAAYFCWEMKSNRFHDAHALCVPGVTLLHCLTSTSEPAIITTATRGHRLAINIIWVVLYSCFSDEGLYVTGGIVIVKSMSKTERVTSICVIHDISVYLQAVLKLDE